MGGLVPVREFTSPEEMRAHYAAVRQRCFAPAVRKLASPPTLALPPLVPKRPWTAPSIVPREEIAVSTTAQVTGQAMLSLTECVRMVGLVADITMIELAGPRRRANLTKARQICSWLGKQYAGASFPQIGKRLGGRDHTTALHGYRRTQAVIDRGLVTVAGDPFLDAKALWEADWPAALMPKVRTQVLHRTPTGQFTAKGQPSC
ncbi:helix-turn-helix domain-containing protein [Methylobacterium sp. B1]|uniref:helix-turn-helix domain-containing protein n=1 Tax=Methylobacterium sp. B1 TaxID=91459 RepID=UPI0005B8B95D|nr:helix-turn-helix domain-containing protein [Methylobacterium sp. B1]